MKTVVYADVYFILNFSIDLICLALCGAIAGKPRKKMRLMIASALGGIYACCALFITYPLLSVISAVAVCFAMYFIAYLPRSLSSSVYGGVLLFCVNALFGGLYSAIVSVASGGRVDTDRFMYYPLFLTVTAALIFVRFINFKSVYDEVYTKITFEGKTARFNSIIDTANALREPISGVGVAVLSRSAAERIFSSDDIGLLSGEGDSASAFSRGFRMIMLNTALGGKKCFCVKGEKVFVEKKRNRTEVCVYFTIATHLSLGETECLLPNSLNLDL